MGNAHIANDKQSKETNVIQHVREGDHRYRRGGGNGAAAATQLQKPPKWLLEATCTQILG